MRVPIPLERLEFYTFRRKENLRGLHSLRIVVTQYVGPYAKYLIPVP